MLGAELFLILVFLNLGSYLVWPSRYNVLQHLAVGFIFIGYFIPLVVLKVQDNYSTEIVELYYHILLAGTICFILGTYAGYLTPRIKTTFSFDILDQTQYEARVINITKLFLIIGIIGLVLSYAGMGFIPMFAADKISAKLFRNEYQAPYMRMALLFRASFYILNCVVPIGCIIWYRYKSKLFFALLLIAVGLMVMSLQRGPAFTGVLFAFIIIMSLKSKFHFFILMLMIIVVFTLSSLFYFIVGVKQLDSDQTASELIAASAPDVSDQLHFLEMFDRNPEWTYGRTIYGGLVPGHYEWNPAVYTLRVVNPGRDINELDSGGLRLPLPMWGYVSFQWPGVVLFCLITGYLAGLSYRYLKYWFYKFSSIVVKTTVISVYAVVFGTFVGFATLSMYSIPPMFVMLFFMYRIKLK